LRLGARQAREDALAQHRSLKLGKYAQHRKHRSCPTAAMCLDPADAGTDRRSSIAIRVADPEDREVVRLVVHGLLGPGT
jgi:hypothetical protein